MWPFRKKQTPLRDECGRYMSRQRQLMLMKARAMRAAKGLPPLEALGHD